MSATENCEHRRMSSNNLGGEVNEEHNTAEEPTTDEDDDVFTKPGMTPEFLSMPLDSKLSKPLLVKKEFTRLSLRPVLSAKLVVNKRGFLPGEPLTFTLTFKNCTKNVVKVATALIQKVAYIGKDGGTSKTTTAVLVQKKLRPTDDGFLLKDGKICWSSGMVVPTFIMPSLSRESKKSVEILYSVQYAMEAEGKPWAGVVSGEAPIVIGTTRKGFSLIPEEHSFTGRGSMPSMETIDPHHQPLSSPVQNSKQKFRRISLMLVPERQETSYGILRLKIDNDNNSEADVPLGKKRNRTVSVHDPSEFE